MPPPLSARRRRAWLEPLIAALAVLLLATAGEAAKIILRDGRVLEGNVALLGSMSDDAKKALATEGVSSRQIVLVDDNLRRTFVAQRQVQEVNNADPPESEETISFPQFVVEGGSQIVGVGQFVNITPFDEFGRRTVTMQTGQGPISIIQGITTLTPKWAKIESLKKSEGQNYIWDMRLATSSIPPDTLERILSKRINADKLDQRLKVVRFYLQAERYPDAEKKLTKLIEDFPEHRAQYEPVRERLRQSIARRILAEVTVRRGAGQYQLAASMLEHFPAEGVAGETLQAVRQMLDQETLANQRRQSIIDQLAKDIEAVQDSANRSRLEPLKTEILAEASESTIDRLAPYWQLRDDAALTVEERVALAISGWLVGPDDTTRNLAVALALADTRAAVLAFLNEPQKIAREGIITKLKSQEGSSPRFVAKLIDHMKPPLSAGEPVEGRPGMYRFDVDVLPGLPTTQYLVQLPPEYDPLRRYPTIVTLHGAETNPALQVDWWAGPPGAEGKRAGQASRQGYIVVAPAWASSHQSQFEFTAAEHAAVLNALRDASRRFAIDSDRVFLSGHSMGGDAAWDIGLAHPDLWAGVLPIGARADKYVAHYWENAAQLPFYFINGEYDGSKAVDNARDFDRYFKNGYNVTSVVFQGRGNEDFSDEILRAFDWMDRYHRDFFPRHFVARTLRRWDNFFWWVELSDLPERVVVEPTNWPPPRGTLALNTEADLQATGGVNVRTGAGRTTLWLSPEVVNFERPARITVNGKSLRTTAIEPDLTVLLEDVRTRADRRHPFWAKVEMPSGKVNE